MGRYSVRLAPLFADFAGVGEGQTVLDVGAGTGALTRELVARGARVVAVEPSPEFARTLRSRFPELEVHEAPAEELPFANDSFDLALAQLVVAFMEDAPAAMRELGRVAHQVAVNMWGVEEVQMFAAIGRTTRVVGGGYAEQGARRYRTPQELHDLLAGAGLDKRRDRRAGRHGAIRRFRGFLAAADPRRRPRRRVAARPRRGAAIAGSRRAVPSARQPERRVRVARPRVRRTGNTLAPGGLSQLRGALVCPHMSVGGILGESWGLYTKFFKRFFVVAVIVYLIVDLLNAVVATCSATAWASRSCSRWSRRSCLSSARSGCRARSSSRWTTCETAGSTDVGQVFERARPYLGTLIVAGILAGLGIAVGLVL